MTDTQKVIEEMKQYVGDSELIRDWASRLEAEQAGKRD